MHRCKNPLVAKRDRLSGLDASFLHLEGDAAHMHVAGCAVFEGKPPSHEELLAAEDARRHALEADLNGRMEAAERQIADTKARAMGSVGGIARDAAAAIVEHLTGRSPDAGAVDAALADTRA